MTSRGGRGQDDGGGGDSRANCGEKDGGDGTDGILARAWRGRLVQEAWSARQTRWTDGGGGGRDGGGDGDEMVVVEVESDNDDDRPCWVDGL